MQAWWWKESCFPGCSGFLILHSVSELWFIMIKRDIFVSWIKPLLHHALLWEHLQSYNSIQLGYLRRDIFMTCFNKLSDTDIVHGTIEFKHWNEFKRKIHVLDLYFDIRFCVKWNSSATAFWEKELQIVSSGTALTGNNVFHLWRRFQSASIGIYAASASGGSAVLLAAFCDDLIM